MATLPGPMCDCDTHRRCGLRTCARWPMILLVTPEDIDPTPTPEELAAQEEFAAKVIDALADAYEAALGPGHPRTLAARRAAASLRSQAPHQQGHQEHSPPHRQECP